MGVWYNIDLGNYKGKYTALTPQIEEYKSCDSDGNILKRVSGKFEKGHFLNEETGETHDKAFKLINGKASEGFKGRVKEVENPVLVEGGESEDILTEKEFLFDCPKLYKHLNDGNKEMVFGGWFGNGFKAYKVYVIPSKLYKGFCIMKAGRGQKSQIIKGIVGDLTEMNDLKEKLASVELTIQKVNKAKVEDLLTI